MTLLSALLAAVGIAVFTVLFFVLIHYLAKWNLIDCCESDSDGDMFG